MIYLYRYHFNLAASATTAQTGEQDSKTVISIRFIHTREPEMCIRDGGGGEKNTGHFTVWALSAPFGRMIVSVV